MGDKSSLGSWFSSGYTPGLEESEQH